MGVYLPGDATSAAPSAASVCPSAAAYGSGVRSAHDFGTVRVRRDDKSFYVLAVWGGPLTCVLERPGEATCT